MKKVKKLAQEIRECIKKFEDFNDYGKFKKILDKHVPIEKPFPKLMETGGGNRLVIFFLSSHNGYVVEAGDSGHEVGHYRSDWIMETCFDCEIEVKK